MGTKYTTNSDTGYNASPPPDDGSTGTDNLVTWAKHKTKLTDPILAYVDDINTDLVSWADNSPTATATNYTTDADDNGRIIETTSSPTITLGTASTMGAGYEVTVKCVSDTTYVGTGETIDGSGTTRTLNAGEAETYVVNNAGSAYMVKAYNGVTRTGTQNLSNKTISSSTLAAASVLMTVTTSAKDNSTKIASTNYVDRLRKLNGTAGAACEIYVTSAYNYTGGGGQVLSEVAHGLSGTPQEVSVIVECLDDTVDTWATVGRRYAVGYHMNETSSWGVQAFTGGTYVGGVVGADGIWIAKTNDGTLYELNVATPADWAIYLVTKYYA